MSLERSFPQAIADFEGLKTIAEATSNAQKLFIALLGGCLYCWLTLGTTKEVALLTNSASSPLPIIGTALPIVGFYLVAPVLLLARYFYFHLNMQRLWEALADLPAVFPDGRPLDKMADPLLLNGFVRAHCFRLSGGKTAAFTYAGVAFNRARLVRCSGDIVYFLGPLSAAP